MIKICYGPTVRVITKQVIDDEAFGSFLVKEAYAPDWETDAETPSDAIPEMAGRLCFDDKTHVLTYNGWKLFSELCEDSEIATLNTSSNNLEFQKILTIHQYDYEGVMLSYEGRDCNFLVTPEHRQYASVRKKFGYDSNFRFYKTEELLDRFSFKVMTSAEYEGGVVPKYIEIPSIEYTQVVSNKTHRNLSISSKVTKGYLIDSEDKILSLAKLCAHYVANGSRSKRGIVIYGKLSNEVRSLANTLELSSRVWLDKRADVPRVSIGGGQPVSKWFSEKCGKNTAEKRLPRWVIELPTKNLKDVWDILIKTDGHTRETGHELFCTGSDYMIDQAEEMAVRLGFSFFTRKVKGTNGPCWVMSRKRGIPAIIKSNRIEKTEYKGKVYCVTTGNGVILVKRKGKPHYSGNCYVSYKSPRPGGNKAYLEHILDANHGSVAEHSVFGLLITGISRSLSHELIRHRAGMSPSELSQRYVDCSDVAFVVPPAIIHMQEESCPGSTHMGPGYHDACEGWKAWKKSCEDSLDAYEKLTKELTKVAPSEYVGTEKRKWARQAARSVLPNCAETKVFMTANVRSLRHMIEMRASRHADAEIRILFCEIYEKLKPLSPNLFGDYVRVDLPDGTYELQTKWRKV